MVTVNLPLEFCSVILNLCLIDIKKNKKPRIIKLSAISIKCLFLHLAVSYERWDGKAGPMFGNRPSPKAKFVRGLFGALDKSSA